MPAQTEKKGNQVASFIRQMGAILQHAHETHKGDETDYTSFSDPPAGIEGGIAKLTDVYISQSDKDGDFKGKWFFRAAGVIVSPQRHDGVKAAGKQISIMEWLCDTPGRARETFEQHWAWVCNELRKLGATTEVMDLTDLEPTMEAMKAEDNPIYFTFSTWKSDPSPDYPNPRTNSRWEGACDPPVIEEGQEANGQFQDNTNGSTPVATPPAPPARVTRPAAAAPARATTAAPPKPSAPPKAPPAKPASPPKAPAAPPKPITPAPKAPTRAPAKPAAPPPPPPPSEPAGEFSEFEDVDSLVAAAINSDREAQDKLEAMAYKRGWTEDQTRAAPDWDAVKEMALNDPPAEGEDAGVEDAAAEATEEVKGWQGDPPKKGNVFHYFPINNKTKQPEENPVEGEVMDVDLRKRTANLKNIDNPKVKYPGVSWDDLYVITTTL